MYAAQQKKRLSTLGLVYTGCTRNSSQTLHSLIPRWEYLKNALRTALIHDPEFTKKILKTKYNITAILDSPIVVFANIYKGKCSSVQCEYRDWLERAVEWMCANVAEAWCPAKYTQHEDELQSPFVLSRLDVPIP
ncbi:hypothetical protein TNCV_2450581 [Trichonephila clavipes]|nr:hypothetical protein TNCV_2450581 [Trichonephila clavipes]